MEDELTKAKKNALKKLVEAHSAMMELHYIDVMNLDPTPECIFAMQDEIDKLRRDLAGA